MLFWQTCAHIYNATVRVTIKSVVMSEVQITKCTILVTNSLHMHNSEYGPETFYGLKKNMIQFSTNNNTIQNTFEAIL